MVDVEVVPETFENVAFEADQIRAVVARLADQLGLADRPGVSPIRIEVDESTPLAKAKVVSLEPLVIHVESGALEDRRKTRQFGEVEAADILGRRLAMSADRLDPAFGGPPLDDQIPIAHATAWDTHLVGRLTRLGYQPQRQRRLYNFELRHGFTDVAIAAFDTLWNTEKMTWDEIVALSDEARAAADAA